MTLRILILPVLVLILFWGPSHAQNGRFVGWNDRFTYEDQSIYRSDGFVDWSPIEWDRITCNEGKKLDECMAYIDKWESGRGWKITRNDCDWCPEGSDQCGRHHQSPVNLLRETGLPLDSSNDLANECIDLHWIKYEDSLCTFQQLKERNAFTIERHALRTSYPLYFTGNAENAKLGDIDDGFVVGPENTVHLDCPISGRGPRFPRMDFSKGFSDHWYLSHVDIHVPSEHTQNGIRFDAEVQMKHFYTLPVGILNEKGQANQNEVGTISVFLQSFDSVPPNPYLDTLICEWREKEQDTLMRCPRDVRSTPIPHYPACRSNGKRDLSQTATNRTQQDFQNVYDVLLHNHFNSEHPNHSDVKVGLDPSNWEEEDERDWNAWIKEQSEQMKLEHDLYHQLKEESVTQRTSGLRGNQTRDVHEQFRRRLANRSPWSDYWPMLGCKTEYYFRYQGSLTTPPCYGKHEQGQRTGVNHWRIMKDPARIHPDQLKELQRLIAERVAPYDDPIAPCKRDTAAKISPQGDVSTARPLQQFNEKGHVMTFCECKDWESKWPEDREWCKIGDIEERFFEKRFNWEA